MYLKADVSLYRRARARRQKPARLQNIGRDLVLRFAPIATR
jgi:hypothetical protein